LVGFENYPRLTSTHQTVGRQVFGLWIKNRYQGVERVIPGVSETTRPTRGAKHGTKTIPRLIKPTRKVVLVEKVNLWNSSSGTAL